MGSSSPGSRALGRYVARPLAQWDVDAPGAAWQEVDGTLCFVDISGFTALSERLADRGRIGAEQLTEIINGVFGRMLRLAHNRGGSLLKFGGDALLLLFAGPDHVVHAASAAVEMRSSLRRSNREPTPAGRLDLRMSTGLHAGPILLFRAGRSHRELLVSGPAATTTARTEAAAGAGEILVSASMADRLPPTATVAHGAGARLRWREPRAEPCGPVATKPVVRSVLASCIPERLRDHVQHQPEPEHRLASIAFVKFSDTDAVLTRSGPDGLASTLDRIVGTVLDAADAEAVTFLATDIDANSGKIILATGVPAAQEDDEGRLLRTAGAIIDADLPLPVRIGVNRGHVFAGEVGSRHRSAYTVMGDTVNLAARLMAAAEPGQILSTPGLLDRSRSRFATTPLEPFTVKGKAEPIHAYAVGEETAQLPEGPDASLPLVGRDAAIEPLIAGLDAARNGSGSAISVEGERGIGKTRLVSEAIQLGGAELDRLELHAEPYGLAMPYRPFRDPVRRIAGVESSEAATMAAELARGVRNIDPALLPWLPLIAEMAGIAVPATPEVEAIELRFRQERTADVLVSLLEAAWPDGAVIFADDCHWMDDASAVALQRLATATATRPWILLATRRERATADDGTGHVLVELGPVAPDAARQLVLAGTAAAPLRSHEVDAIVTRGAGNPLFLIELVGAVRDAGGVDALPETVDAVVSTEIDSLPPPARRLLRHASVLGRSFRTAVLREILAEDGLALDDVMREQLLRFLEPEGDDRVRFRHALLRDVAYNTVSFDLRRQLHLQAAFAIERLAGDDTSQDSSILALHFSLAHDAERTWRYARIAGDRAEAAYANIEAATHYQRAADAGRRLGSAPLELARVWAQLGDVRARAGQFVEALAAYRQASRLASDDPVAHAEMTLKRARARERSGEYRTALRETAVAYRSIADSKTQEAAATRARLTAFRALVRQAQQRPHAALELAEQAIRESEVAGEREAMARSYQILDWAYRTTGQPARAKYAGEALALWESLGDLGAQGMVVGNQGVEAYFDGRWGDAADLYATGRAMLWQTGDIVQSALFGANQGELLINLGRLDEAAEVLEESRRDLRASGFDEGASFAAMQQARLRAAQGDWQGAEHDFAAAREEFDRLGQAGSALEAASYQAECHIALGDALGAITILDEADSCASEEAVYAATVARVRSAALAELGELEAALGSARSATTTARQQGLRYELARVLQLEARLLGDRDGAAAEAEAKQILHDLGVPSG